MPAPTRQAPNPGSDERRSRRSDDTMTALHYQLAFARHEGGFEALVLADSSGCLVAGAGAWPTCEMLAAYAPLFADPSSSPADAEQMEVQKLLIDGSEVLLCARGGSTSRAPSMARAVAGCRRILGATA